MREHDRSRWANRRAPDRDPWREHDACGVGCVARASGERSSGIVALALQALARVAHRGAASTDHSGDGAGLLVQIPRGFFHREAARLGLSLAPERPFAVGMFFLPPHPAARDRATAIIEDVLHGAGLPVLGWRDVPVEPAVLGPTARATCPAVRQAVIAAPAAVRQVDAPAWERSLYLARRIVEQRIAAAGPELEGFFACSLSCRTVVYKALLTGTQLPAFFPDLVSPDFESAIAVFHQRYSTNTRSSWALAQPFRLLGHNGEINPLWGNRNAMAAREPALASPLWDEGIDRLKPVIWAEGSDSTSLDNALELLVRSGRDPVHALMMLRPEAGVTLPACDGPELVTRQLAFGWSFEDLRYVAEPMATAGQDTVWSMGDDTPIPPLSRIPQSLYAYFRQRFAQVTNPAIDPLRETLVMSLRMHLGRRGSLLADSPAALRLVRTEHPILLEDEIVALRNLAGDQGVTLPALWRPASGPDPLRSALDGLCTAAERAVRLGARILIVSDRDADAEHPPLPMLLAIGAVHQHLLRQGLRTRLGLAAEAGDAWDVHHFAALIGYGAEAVHPWLALASVRARLTPQARTGFRAAAEKGLLKILSKMGISTLSSYRGAQIFEALGLGAEVIDRCFTGTVSTIGGIGFAEIAEDVLARHLAAYGDEGAERALPDHGRVRFRKDGEDHGWSPPLVRAMQTAVEKNTPEAYDGFKARVAARLPASPRDLLAIRAGTPIPLDEVEPAETIRRRFISTAMSLGALSPEAHRTLAIGMNRMGARSNSGEGGEDPDTYAPLENGDRADNRIKQVASGRFGVTTYYLMRADELEIKIAQGSKPGEGGQLPAHKVTALIARLRHPVPGVPLISPPPHHDIYSIEDLAQLIHDLKQVNPHARVGVKLVAEAGVGRVAAGVAKAYADYVLVSGHNGGTGASPLSSIKHAGSPWELGLAETQAILIENGLRHRIEVRTDGGLRTGRDVVIAALLGAESYGFGTAALVAIGCDMARQCHLNSCPTGIATQKPELRAKFRGTPEQVVAYFSWIAEDVRRLLAALGCRSLDDAIGRVDLLERVDHPEVPRAQMLDLSLLLTDPLAGREEPRRRTVQRNDRPGVESLDDEILSTLEPRLDSGRPFAGVYDIGNHHLTVGARIAGRIAERHGNVGLPPGSVRLRFRGSAGQSFGAFALPGMQLELEGEANDYVGKGLTGGEIVIRPFREAAAAGSTDQHVLLGNTALYGATAGRLFAAGRAGDRFAVRNSGVIAVIEGAGAHCCEYMTAGVVVVLGPVGRNFAAGMSNGVAYVLDETETFTARCNTDMVAVRLLEPFDEDRLLDLLREHVAKTGSAKARAVLEAWDRCGPLFRKVVPNAAPTPAVAPAETTPVAV